MSTIYKAELLVGKTTDWEFVFIEPNIREDNGKYIFSLSSFSVLPFNIDKYDTDEAIEELVEETMADCLDDKTILDLLDKYDCSPSDLARNIMYERGGDVRDYLDCSLFPEQIDSTRHSYVFESFSCGQCDFRGKIAEFFMDAETFNTLMQAWDEWHLKDITDEKKQEIIDLVNTCVNVDDLSTNDWIAEHLD